LRLFVAININSETRSNLLALHDELRGKSERGRFSLPENLHLTLVFLGECDVAQVAAAKEAMDAVVFDPFDLVVERVGRFRRGGGDIWWAGVRENTVLLSLQQKLTSGLRSKGFHLEKREYSPHITLGREIVTEAIPRPIEPFGETVSKIDLMKSEHIRGKLTYTSIYRRGVTELGL